MSIKEYYEKTLISGLFKCDDNIEKEHLPSLSVFIDKAIKNKILPSDVSLDTDFNGVVRCLIDIFQDHIEYLENISTIGLNRYKNFLKNDFKYVIIVLDNVCPLDNVCSVGYLKVLKTEYENALPVLDC